MVFDFNKFKIEIEGSVVCKLWFVIFNRYIIK